MKFRDCTSINSTENIQEGYRNGLSKTALEFKNCKQQLFTLTMRLAACLWAQILARPRLNHDHSSDASCKMWWLSISETDSSVSSIREKYRIASMFIITRAVSTHRDVERRESGSMFCEIIEIISWSSYESSRKHENIALKGTVTKQWS